MTDGGQPDPKPRGSNDEVSAEPANVRAPAATPPAVFGPSGCRPRLRRGPQVNKLHEWALAILIMAILTGILFFFLSFMRGAGL